MHSSQHNEYLAILNQIADLQKKKLAYEDEQRKLYKRIRTIHAKHELEIGTAKNDNGKPRYSNEQLRKAALTLRLDEDTEFCKLRERIDATDHEVRLITIEFNKLVDHKYLLMIELGIPMGSENEKYPELTVIQ